jgi:hypothetical protein
MVSMSANLSHKNETNPNDPNQKRKKIYFLTLDNLNLQLRICQEMPLMKGQINSQKFSYISNVGAFLPSYERNHLFRIHTDWIYGGD